MSFKIGERVTSQQGPYGTVSKINGDVIRVDTGTHEGLMPRFQSFYAKDLQHSDMTQGDLDRLETEAAYRVEAWRHIVDGSDLSSTHVLHALDLWDGDYEIRRRNGSYRIVLFEPSMQWEGHGLTFAQALTKALSAVVENRDQS